VVAVLIDPACCTRTAPSPSCRGEGMTGSRRLGPAPNPYASPRPCVAELAGPDARRKWELFSIKDRRTVVASLVDVTINKLKQRTTRPSIRSTGRSPGRRLSRSTYRRINIEQQNNESPTGAYPFPQGMC
jgi:hypothetical protein